MIEKSRRLNLRIKPLQLIGFFLGLSFLKALPIIGNYRFVSLIMVFLIVYTALHFKSKRTIKLVSRSILLLVFILLSLIINQRMGGDPTWNEQQIMCISGILLIICAAERKDLSLVYAFVLGCNIWNVVSLFDVINVVLHTSGDTYRGLLLCGYDNGLGSFLLPLICFNLFFFFSGYNAIITFGSSIIAALQISIVLSVTPLFAVVVIGLLTLFEIKNNIYDRIRPWILLATSYITFFVIVVLQMIDIPFITWFLTNVLKRTTDFSSRTYVWKSGIAYFSTSPIWGHGRNADLQRTLFYGVSSAHNFFLDVLTQVGVVGFTVITVYLIYLVIHKKETYAKKNNLILYVNALIVLFVMQFESYCAYFGYPLFITLLSLMLYLNEFQTVDRKFKKIKFKGR